MLSAQRLAHSTPPLAKLASLCGAYSRLRSGPYTQANTHARTHASKRAPRAAARARTPAAPWRCRWSGRARASGGPRPGRLRGAGDKIPGWIPWPIQGRMRALYGRSSPPHTGTAAGRNGQGAGEPECTGSGQQIPARSSSPLQGTSVPRRSSTKNGHQFAGIPSGPRAGKQRRARCRVEQPPGRATNRAQSGASSLARARADAQYDILW